MTRSTTPTVTDSNVTLYRGMFAASTALTCGLFALGPLGHGLFAWTLLGLGLLILALAVTPSRLRRIPSPLPTRLLGAGTVVALMLLGPRITLQWPENAWLVALSCGLIAGVVAWILTRDWNTGQHHADR